MWARADGATVKLGCGGSVLGFECGMEQRRRACKQMAKGFGFAQLP